MFSQQSVCRRPRKKRKNHGHPEKNNTQAPRYHHTHQFSGSTTTISIRQPCTKALSLDPSVKRSHFGYSCDMCELFSQQSVGGRPQKDRKNCGHFGNNSTHSLEAPHTIVSTSFQVVQPLYPSWFHTAASNISLADFQCSSCTNILNHPI